MLITLSYALDFMFIFIYRIYRIEHNTFPLFQQKKHIKIHIYSVF